VGGEATKGDEGAAVPSVEAVVAGHAGYSNARLIATG